MEQAERILFVDDDEPVRNAFARALRRYGFTIDIAASAPEALELAQQHTYSVVATDYRMPELNGLELVQEMRLWQPDTAYVLVSGECDMDLCLSAVNDHAISFVLTKPWDTEDLASMLRRAQEAYWERSHQRRIQTNAINHSRALDLQKARLAAQQAQHEGRLTEALLTALVIRGQESFAHCRRVAAYAQMIAKRMGVRGRMLGSIRKGAMLHDVGKIAVSDEVLQKEGPLSEGDWEVMRRHTIIGAQLLEGFEGLDEARLVVLQHHERWDGSGYPNGLSGDQICLGARIFAVADALDAMLSYRAYRPSISLKQALDEIRRCAGTQFDPAVVQAFESIPIEQWMIVRARYPDEVPTPAQQAS